MENLDLLEPSDLRKLAKAAAGRTVQDEATNEDDKFELPTNSEGKLIINVSPFFCFGEWLFRKNL